MKSNVDTVSICSDGPVDEVGSVGMDSFERRSMIGMVREMCVRDSSNRRGIRCTSIIVSNCRAIGWSCSIRRWCCGRLRVAVLGQTHPCRLAGRSLFAPDARTKPHAALAWPNTGTDPGKLTTISRPAISLHLRQLALLPFSQLFLILCFTLFFGLLDQSTLISQLLSQLLSSLLSSGSSIYLHPLFYHHARSISFYRPPLALCSTTACKKDIY